MNDIYTTLGASNHTLKERQAKDYYSTYELALEDALKYALEHLVL